MSTLDQLRLGERENGYKQCYTDVQKILIQILAENHFTYTVVNDIQDRITKQLAIREVSGFAHPEEVVNPSIPL